MGYLVFGFIIILLLYLPPLIRQKKGREITVLALLFIAVFTLAALYLAGVLPQSPILAAGELIKQVFFWK